MGNWTIAIAEVVRGAETVHVITASSKRGYDMLRSNPRWLRPWEVVLGEHINYYTAVEGRRGKQTNGNHAEQLAPWAVGAKLSGARVRVPGGRIVRVVASSFICEVCIRWYEEFYPEARLINPNPKVQLRQRAGQPPAVPTRAIPGPIIGPGGSPGSTFSVGQRAAAGAVLAVQGVNYLLGEYVTRREAARYQEAVRAKEGFLRRFQDENPTIGVLVIAYFEGAVFRPPLELSYGMTERQAIGAAPPILRQGEVRSVVSWRPPLRAPDVTDLRPPFPPVRLATFVGRQIFQNIEFRGFDGFDDDGETDLGHSSTPARFWILQPPSNFIWYNSGSRGSTEVELTTRRLASGEPVRCLDLDPTSFSIGGDSAFPAFPADMATDALFMRAPRISDRVHALRAYDLDRIRWIPPGRARSIGG